MSLQPRARQKSTRPPEGGQVAEGDGLRESVGEEGRDQRTADWQRLHWGDGHVDPEGGEGRPDPARPRGLTDVRSVSRKSRRSA